MFAVTDSGKVFVSGFREGREAGKVFLLDFQNVRIFFQKFAERSTSWTSRLKT
jgi:hypothetical protein